MGTPRARWRGREAEPLQWKRLAAPQAGGHGMTPGPGNPAPGPEPGKGKTRAREACAAALTAPSGAPTARDAGSKREALPHALSLGPPGAGRGMAASSGP